MDRYRVAVFVPFLRLDNGIMGAGAGFLIKHVLPGRNRNSKTMLQGLCNMEVTLDML
ncbi:hypothetical protein D3C75_1237260 [compost metagenome]